MQRETQKPHKRRNRNRNRKRKASSVPTSAVFLGDIFKCPAHIPLSEQEQSIDPLIAKTKIHETHELPLLLWGREQKFNFLPLIALG